MRHPHPRAGRLTPARAAAVAGTAGAVLLVGLLSGCGQSRHRAGAEAPAPSTSPALLDGAPETRAPGLPTGTPVPGGAGLPTGPVGRPGTATSTGGRTATTGVPTGRTSTTTATAAPACAGSPSGDQVVAMLRQTSGLLPDGQPVQVVTGPLCAGDWQYTVVSVQGRDALQV